MANEPAQPNVADRSSHPGRMPIGWTVAGVLVLAIVLLAVFWDWNWFRPIVEAQASAAIGRPVTLKHFDLQPGRQTVAIADGVTIANPADFPSDKPFATIDRLAVTIDVMAYLHGRNIVVPAIVVDHPDIEAAQPAGHAPNWLFPALSPKPGAPPAPAPQIGDLQINDGHAHVLDPALKADFAADIATSAPTADGERQIRIEETGTYAGQPITGQAIGGALLSLRDAAHPYPIDLHIANGETRVSLVGTVQNPMNFAGAKLKLRFSGPDMSQLYPLTGIPLPKTPPFDIAGNLDYTARKIVFRDFSGKVGSSDLEGDITVDPLAAPPLVTADLKSRSVDLADLGGFIGSQPGRLSTPNQSPQQKQELARAEASPKLLPTKPIDLPTLRAANVHLKYIGGKIIGKGVPFDRIDVVMSVDDGRIRLTPIALGVGRGQIAGTIDLAPLNDKQIKLSGDIRVQRADLGALLAATGVTHGSGVIGGHAVLDSTGNSMASFAANGDGSVQLVMSGGGDLSALLVDISGFEFGNSLLSALGVPRNDQIECFVGDWGLRQGILSTRTLILDTSDNITQGSGDVNLRNETLDYRLKTEAKHFSIGTLPAPIGITGPFKNPSIKPEILPLAARTGVAAALGFLFPPAALLPTIQFGVGDDPHCAPLAHGGKR
jgi:AsmA family protein